MGDGDIETLRMLVPASLTATTIAAFALLVVFTRSAAGTAQDETVYWTAFRRTAVILVPFVLCAFQFVAMAGSFILLTEPERKVFPSFADSSHPIFYPLNNQDGVLHHPESVLPLLIEVAAAVASWVLILTIVHLAYFLFNNEVQRQKTHGDDEERVISRDLAGLSERTFVAVFSLAGRAATRVFERLFLESAYTIVSLGLPALVILIILNRTVITLPQLTLTLILGPLWIAESILLLAGHVTGFAAYIRSQVRVLTLFVCRYAADSKPEVLVCPSSPQSQYALPGHVGWEALPVVYPEEQDIRPTGQVVRDYLEKYCGASGKLALENTIEERPTFYRHKLYRVTICDILVTEGFDCTGELVWRDAKSVVDSAAAHQTLRDAINRRWPRQFV